MGATRGNKQKYRIKPTAVTSPSEFKARILEREWQMAEMFQGLHHTYYGQPGELRVPVGDMVEELPIVFAESENIVGRGHVIDIDRYEGMVWVYDVDDDETYEVGIDHVFYMDRRTLSIPRFICRFAISDVCPRENATWNMEAGEFLREKMRETAVWEFIVRGEKDEIYSGSAINSREEISLDDWLVERGLARRSMQDLRLFPDEDEEPLEDDEGYESEGNVPDEE